MKNKFLKSEFIVLAIASLFVFNLYLYFFSGRIIFFIQEVFWFLVLIGFAWYGAYKRLEEIERRGKCK